jgi:hypothetical protein
MFKSTLFGATGGLVDATGGLSNANNGGDGRYVTSDNGGVTPDYGVAVGATQEHFVGLAANGLNPFISGGTTVTSNIVDLAGGADVYGVKAFVTASDAYFKDVRSLAPANSVAAVVRQLVGPSPGEQYASQELLLLVNLTDQPLADPRLGVGSAGEGFTAPLAVRGISNNPLFGGSGPTVLTQLESGAVFATLISTGSQFLTMEVNAAVGGATLTPIPFDSLTVAYLTLPAPTSGDFNRDGFVDGVDLLIWQRGESPSPNSPTDLADWQKNFASGAMITGSPVPEPAAHIIVAAAMLACAVHRRSR